VLRVEREIAVDGATEIDIINSYIENPNPNGNTVCQLLDTGILGDLVTPVDAYLSFHGKTPWLGALATACAKLGLVLDREALSREYDRVPMMNARKTVKFATPLAMLNFFREAGKQAFETLGFNAPELVLEKEKVVVAIIGDAQKVEYNIPALDQIKTASFTGGGIMVKAPYNPAVVSLKCFYINPEYFRGRFNAQNIRANQNRLIAGQTGIVTSMAGGTDGAHLVEDKGLGVSENGYYQCIQLNVQFDTYNVNEMQVTGVMANATTDNSLALKEAIDKYQGEKLDGYFLEYPPEWV
jgi:carbon monoxide dehydrogenase subunit G